LKYQKSRNTLHRISSLFIKWLDGFMEHDKKHDLESDEFVLLSHIKKKSQSGTVNEFSSISGVRKVFHLFIGER
jgi:hypothetical protein